MDGVAHVALDEPLRVELEDIMSTKQLPLVLFGLATVHPLMDAALKGALVELSGALLLVD
jgi:hypothetical protein